jgi:[lysine-biosynthesis-protein LysW]---L-2-aminoadipate ligase
MPTRPTLAVTASRVRLEERLIFGALERRGVPYDQVDTRQLYVMLDRPPGNHLGVLNREISHTRSTYAARMFEFHGVPVINSAAVLELCGDKLLTTLALRSAGVPTPRAALAMSPESALAAVAELGYPAVVKPMIGSWGHLAARLVDEDMAETVFEHRSAMPGPLNRINYLQEYVDKPGRDIKAYVIGGEVLCAIYKRSDSWRTNTARGGIAEPCPVSDELERLLRASSGAVGGGILGIDVMESPDGRLLVNEVNHTPEFHGAIDATGVDIAGAIVDYALRILPLD